jgi:hypothetical protein
MEDIVDLYVPVRASCVDTVRDDPASVAKANPRDDVTGKSALRTAATGRSICEAMRLDPNVTAVNSIRLRIL